MKNLRVSSALGFFFFFFRSHANWNVVNYGVSCCIYSAPFLSRGFLLNALNESGDHWLDQRQLSVMDDKGTMTRPLANSISTRVIHMMECTRISFVCGEWRKNQKL